MTARTTRSGETDSERLNALNSLEFLAFLRNLDVRLWVENGALRCDAPRDVLSPVIREQLSAREAGLRRLLEVGGSKLHAITPVSKAGWLPQSHAQQRLWLTHQLAPDSTAYHMAGAVRLDGALSVTALEGAFDLMLQRHDILRTVFAMRDGLAVQRVGPILSFRLPVVDLGGLAPEPRESFLHRLAREQSGPPFDLENGRLLRVQLLRQNPCRHLLPFCMHHIVSDEGSINIFYAEIETLYQAISRGQPSPLRPLPIQYADYACWQAQRLQGAYLRELMSYWLPILTEGASLPAAPYLPQDHARPPTPTFRGARRPFRLSAPLSQALEQLAKAEQCTLFTLLLTAFAALLHRYGNPEQVMIGTPISGRRQEETEQLIGFFVNILLIRVFPAGNPSFRQLLRQVHDQVMGAFAHEEMPFDLLLTALKERGVPDPKSLARVSFALHHAPARTAAGFSGGPAMSAMGVERGGAQTDLLLIMERKDGCLNGTFEYATDLFETLRINRIIEDWRLLLEGVAEDADRPLALLPPRLPQALAGPDRAKTKQENIGVLAERTNLTMNQLLFWVGQKLYAGSPLFNMGGIAWIKGPLIVDRLRAALRILVRTNDALRTVFLASEGVPYRKVRDRMDVDLPYTDLSFLPPAGATKAQRLWSYPRRALAWVKDPEGFAQARALPWKEGGPEGVRDWAGTFCREPFDLKRRLFRLALFKIAPRTHALVLAYHHLLGDAFVGALFLRRLSEIYAGINVDEEHAAPSPPQFEAYFRQERARIKSKRYARLQRFWDAYLKQDLEAIHFYGVSADAMDAANVVGRRVSLPLSAAGLEILKARYGMEWRQSGDLTLLQIFATVFASWLHRISGLRRLGLGIAHHNRRTKADHETIGLFMGVLPLRITIARAETFASLLQKIKAETLRVLKNAPCPAENLMNGNSQGRPYHLFLNYANAPVPSFSGEPMEIEWVYPGFQEELIAVNLRRTGHPDRMVVDFDLREAAFEGRTGARVAAHFERVFEQLVKDGEGRLDQLNILSAEEERRLLVDLNQTQTRLPPGFTLPTAFEAWAQRAPNAIAVTHGSCFLTYSQLNARANRWARIFRRRGLREESIIAALDTRGLDMLSCILAIFKAGGAWLPLDPAYPPERLAKLLQQSGCRLVLYGETYSECFQSLPRTDSAVGLPFPALDREAVGETNLGLANQPDQLAYVIFTSGSTGLPKGAMVSHRGMMNHLHAKTMDLSLSSSDRVAQTASQCFDISIWQFLVAQAHGGRTVIAGDELVRDPSALLAWIAACGLTVWETVPSFLRSLLDLAEGRAPAPLPALRWMMVTGEALPPDLCRRWRRAYPRIPLVNAYGPTECSDDVTHAILGGGLAEVPEPVPIGVAVCNTRLYVLDPDLLPAPEGVAGELHVAGWGVGRGYLYEPCRTAEAFIPDAIGAETGGRLYKTGDRVRYNRNLELEFLGRLDHQVKVRGFRIEVGEIEAALRDQAGIRDAAVLPFEDRAGQTGLAAYLVSEPDRPARNSLCAGLRKQLPEYMLPTVFHFLEAFPLTPNGKLDRRALPAPSREPASISREVMACRDTLELRLIRLWEELLGVHPIGIRDSFFDLGGHSLLAVQMMARVQQELNRELPLSHLYEEATIERLAHGLRNQTGGRTPSPLVPIQPRGEKPPFFCVHPGSGDVFTYLGWAPYLEKDQPFFGLQDPKIHGEEDPYTGLADMAEHYIYSLREVQPEGPYYLGGWSFGGQVAFEMALQLERAGESVALLALIDTGAKDYLETKFAQTDDADLLATLALESIPALDQPHEILARTLRALDGERQIQFVLNLAQEHGFFERVGGGTVPYIRRALALFKVRMRVVHDYQPRKYGGPILLIRGEQQPGDQAILSRFGESAGWDQLTSGELFLHRVPGNHATLVLPPNAAQLIQALKPYLPQS